MRYGTVCSGIEAPTVAWHALGWTPQWFSEIEPFPKAVLAHHYPDVPDLGDMTKVNWSDYAGSVDLVAGGTPCQAFSVAGLRKGLADPRGNLTLEFLRVLDAVRPTWVVWENVPGVLSSGGGRDFGTFLGGLGQLGYGFTYRVLNAQYFGVPQRRRRVFVVGHLGDWRRAAAVLFERHSLQGHPAPRREAREEVAPTLSARTKGGGGLGTDFDLDGGLIHQAFGGNNTGGVIDVATACNAKGGSGRMDFETETFVATTLRARDMSRGVDSDYTDTLIPQCITGDVTHALKTEGHDGSEDGTGRGVPIIAFPGRMSGTQCASTEDLSPSLGALNPTAICFSSKDHGADACEDLAPTLRASGHTESHANAGAPPAVAQQARGSMRVRRLVPEECEALQGFPRGYTRIPWRGKPAEQCPDGPRYKALGNSWATVVGKWIGDRIQLVQQEVM